MRVLLVDTGRSWRGGQQQVALLARRLSHNGIELLVAAAPDLAGRLRDDGVAATHLAPVSDLDLPSAVRLARITRWFRPDVLHAHDARAHAMARWVQVLGHPVSLVVTRRVTFHPRTRLKYRYGVSRYVAISKAVRDSLTAAGVAHASIDVIPSAIAPIPDGESAANVTFPGRDRAVPLIAVACALTREKGVDTVVQAAAVGERFGLRAQWIVWGEGPRRAAFEALARRLRAPVWFAGQREDIGAALRAAAVLVHVPRSEGLGTAVLHALARGVPVVATAVGGLPEIVTEAVGSLVPPDDPAAVVLAARGWLTDPERRAAVYHHGPVISARFDMGRMVQKTIDCYSRARNQACDRGWSSVDGKL